MKVRGRNYGRDGYKTRDISKYDHILFGEGEDAVEVTVFNGQVEIRCTGMGRRIVVLPVVSNVITVKAEKI